MALLSTRKKEDRQKLQTLEKWHEGTVVIDDFHRLDESLRQQIVDYLKYLADTEPEAKKLVITGIPHTRQKLVNLAFDLATRIDVFDLGRVEDDIVQRMIEKGEEALNINFDRKSEIVRAASGSLNIAQYICYNICSSEDVLQTFQGTQRLSIRCDVGVAVADVLKDLSMKFDEPLRCFAALGGHKNAIALRLLEELARCEDGFLSLPDLRSKRPDLATGISRFINEQWIDTLYQNHPDSRRQFFFDRMGAALVADDPQLIFYLGRTSLSQLAKEVGKVASLAQRKVFISYSHQDAKWLKRLQVHLKPLEQEGIIDLWDDTKIAAGTLWQDKIQEALETARVALVLVSADFLASDFIVEHELPKLLSRAVSGGTTIIPIILSPCLFNKSGLAIFQAANPPNKSLSDLDHTRQERVLMHVAEAVSKRLETEEA